MLQSIDSMCQFLYVGALLRPQDVLMPYQACICKVWMIDLFLFSWKPSRLDSGDEIDKEGHFKIITTANNREYFTEFIHLDEVIIPLNFEHCARKSLKKKVRKVTTNPTMIFLIVLVITDG